MGGAFWIPISSRFGKGVGLGRAALSTAPYSGATVTFSDPSLSSPSSVRRQSSPSHKIGRSLNPITRRLRSRLRWNASVESLSRRRDLCRSRLRFFDAGILRIREDSFVANLRRQVG